MCILAALGGPLVRLASARRAHTYLAAVPPPEAVLEFRCLFVPPVFYCWMRPAPRACRFRGWLAKDGHAWRGGPLAA